MGKTYRRFRIEFSGKNFPEYYPSAVTITADDEAIAKEWSNKQLEAWKLAESKIRVSIVEVLAPSEPVANKAQAQAQATEGNKTQPKSNRVSRKKRKVEKNENL